MKSILAVGAIASATLLLLSACSSGGSSTAASAARPSTVKVLYEVDGTSTGADITLETGDGTSQQSVKVPLKGKTSGNRGLTFVMQRGSFVYISAQNKGKMNPNFTSSSDFYGTVTCRITVDGVVVSENTTTSQYGIATCKGTAD